MKEERVDAIRLKLYLEKFHDNPLANIRFLNKILKSSFFQAHWQENSQKLLNYLFRKVELEVFIQEVEKRLNNSAADVSPHIEVLDEGIELGIAEATYCRAALNLKMIKYLEEEQNPSRHAEIYKYITGNDQPVIYHSKAETKSMFSLIFKQESNIKMLPEHFFDSYILKNVAQMISLAEERIANFKQAMEENKEINEAEWLKVRKFLLPFFHIDFEQLKKFPEIQNVIWKIINKVSEISMYQQVQEQGSQKCESEWLDQASSESTSAATVSTTIATISTVESARVGDESTEESGVTGGATTAMPKM